MEKCNTKVFFSYGIQNTHLIQILCYFLKFTLKKPQIIKIHWKEIFLIKYFNC